MRYHDRSENGTLLTGNDRFSGYCIDLLRAIAVVLKFEYYIYIVEDRQYGRSTLSPTGKREWNGMIGDLINEVSWLFLYYM